MRRSKCLLWASGILLLARPVLAQNTQVTDLENKIRTTVAGKPAASVDKPALRELNTLKLQLLNALAAECAGLEKDAANHEISDRGRAAVQAAIKQNQEEQTSINDSLGAWTTGLEPEAPRASVGVTSAPATPSSPPVTNSGVASKPVSSGDSSNSPSKIAAGDPPASIPPSPPDRSPAPNQPEIAKASGPPNSSQGLTKGEAAAGATPQPGPPTTCPNSSVDLTLDKPTLDAVDLDATPIVVTGKLSKDAAGTVQVCSDGKLLGKATAASSGSFKVPSDGSSGLPLTKGQKIQAQFINSANTYGPPSDEQLVGSCSLIAGAGTAPTLSVSADDNKATYSGTLNGAAKGTQVRICVNDLPIDQPASVGSDGKFDGGSTTLSIRPGDTIVAQSCSSNAGKSCTSPYGPVSKAQTIANGPLVVGNPEKKWSSHAEAIVIGGAEYAGYSSQAQTTDGFLSIFYQGPLSSEHYGVRGWGLIRLTSAAQPATNGVVSVISNPTGLTTYNFSNVGQVLDYKLGPSWHFADHWSLIGEFGAITPLSSQSAPVTFVAPAAGSQECTTLLNRFSPKNGYNPGLPPNTATPPTACLAAPYTDIAFSNQDRTNFFMKYGAGFRTWYPFESSSSKSDSSGAKPSTAVAVVDATLGQDSSVTGGKLRGVVFKLDGQLPIPTGGGSSWLYLFGASYIRLERNKNLPPLILQSPPSAVTVPSPNVFVLPLVQPNRDYYRLGVGLNINELWCKSFGSGCPTSSQDSGTNSPVPAITSFDPPNATSPATADLPLTVIGKNFVSGSQIKWNNVALNGVQFVNDTKLTVTVPKANLAKSGTAQVIVVNPSPGGGPSSAASYQVK